MTLRALACAALAAICLVGVAAGLPSAGAQTVGPTIVLDRTGANPGDRVTVTFDGWRARVATLSVCGNRAARGSGDCNMIESQGVRLRHMDVTMVHEMTAASPALPCPCVIRAVGVDTGEVAVTPIELIGHPVGPVVEPTELREGVSVQVRATETGSGVAGWLRSSLGGPSPHEASVSVTNVTTNRWTDVVLAGTVSRAGGDQVASFELTVPELGPNATWTGTAAVDVPAPAVGAYTWKVTASGAGPSVTAQAQTRSVPWLLAVLLALLVGDLVMIVTRWLRRRRERGRALDARDGEGVLDLTGEDDVVPGARPDHVPIGDDVLSGSR